MPNRNVYQARKRAGLCPTCGGGMDDTAFHSCRLCRRLRSVYRAALKDGRRESGECLLCGKPLEAEDKGYKRCKKCRAYMRDAQRRYRERKKMGASRDV